MADPPKLILYWTVLSLILRCTTAQDPQFCHYQYSPTTAEITSTIGPPTTPRITSPPAPKNCTEEEAHIRAKRDANSGLDILVCDYFTLDPTTSTSPLITTSTKSAVPAIDPIMVTSPFSDSKNYMCVMPESTTTLLPTSTADPSTSTVMTTVLPTTESSTPLSTTTEPPSTTTASSTQDPTTTFVTTTPLVTTDAATSSTPQLTSTQVTTTPVPPTTFDTTTESTSTVHTTTQFPTTTSAATTSASSSVPTSTPTTPTSIPTTTFAAPTTLSTTAHGTTSDPVTTSKTTPTAAQTSSTVDSTTSHTTLSASPSTLVTTKPVPATTSSLKATTTNSGTTTTPPTTVIKDNVTTLVSTTQTATVSTTTVPLLTKGSTISGITPPPSTVLSSVPQPITTKTVEPSTTSDKVTTLSTDRNSTTANVPTSPVTSTPTTTKLTTKVQNATTTKIDATTGTKTTGSLKDTTPKSVDTSTTTVTKPSSTINKGNTTASEAPIITTTSKNALPVTSTLGTTKSSQDTVTASKTEPTPKITNTTPTKITTGLNDRSTVTLDRILIPTTISHKTVVPADPTSGVAVTTKNDKATTKNVPTTKASANTDVTSTKAIPKVKTSVAFESTTDRPATTISKVTLEKLSTHPSYKPVPDPTSKATELASTTTAHVTTNKMLTIAETTLTNVVTSILEETTASVTTVKKYIPPGTLSPKDAAYFEKIKNKIANLVEDKNKPLKNATGTSEYLKELSPQDIVDMATKIASGNYDEILGNQTKAEFLENLKKNLDNANDALAEAMNKIIKELSEQTIDSPASLGAVLGGLKNALDNSMTVSIGNSKVRDTTDGNYNVMFGTIRSAEFDAVACRSVVRLQGNDAYLKGDVRSALVQEKGQNILTASILNKEHHIVFTGSFAQSSAVFLNEPSMFDSNKLYNDQLRLTPEVEPEFALFEDAFSMLSLHAQLWNVTWLMYSTREQPQLNSSATAYLAVKELSLSFDGMSDTMLKDLQTGKSLPLIKAQIKVKSLGDTVDVINFGAASLSLSEYSKNIGVLTIDNAEVWDIVKSTMSRELLKVITFPIVIENVNCSMIGRTAVTTLQFEAASDSLGMVMPVMLPGNLLPIVDNTDKRILNASVTFNSDIDATETLKGFEENGEELSVTGKLSTLTIAYSLDGAKMINKGKSIKIVQKDGSSIELVDVKYEFKQTSFKEAVISFTAGNVVTKVIKHDRTVIELGGGTTIILTGGFIKRNGTDGYAITEATVTSIGKMPSNSIDLNPQSLMNQDSQNKIMGILNDTAAFLRDNATSLTDEEMENTAKNIMDITGSLIDTIMNALNNPLEADKASNLAREKANYDDLFTVLPSDGGKIRYIEEYTEEEWALEAAQLAQEAIARKMAKQIADVMDALLDGLATRAIANGEIPFLVTMSSSGQTVVAAGGNSSFMLNQTYKCNEWTTNFPPSLADINVYVIKDSDNYRLNMFCFGKNPYAYTWGYKLLVTSGTVELAMKKWTGEKIVVENTPKPIYIRGAGTAAALQSTQMFPDDFLDYQIVDLSTIRTKTWNNSIVLEFEIISELETDDIYSISKTEFPQLYVFLSFQNIPGPMPGEHDHMFKAKRSGPSRFFIPANKLYNMTGLFFLGVGQLADPATDTNETMMVKYPDTAERGVEWNFMRGLTAAYEVRMLTKGCFFYNSVEDRFESSGVTVVDSSGDRYVKCAAHHLTSFSVGLFTPKPDLEFNYEYIMDILVKNQGIIMINLLCFVVLALVGTCAYHCDQKDVEKGRMRTLTDNSEGDQYQYVLAIETGLRAFSSTESKFKFNIYGTKATDMGRSLATDQDDYWGAIKLWGTTTRYLMTTQWPLGDITGIHLWITEQGIQYRESWHIQKIAVMDLQTKKITYFDVDRWIGNAAKTGRTDLRIRNPSDELEMPGYYHQILANMFVWSCFTAGDGLDRLRLTRVIHVTAFGLSILFTNFVLVLILDLEFLPEPGLLFDFVGVKLTWVDIVCAIFGAAMMFFLTNLVLWLVNNTMSFEENEVHDVYKRKEKDFVPHKTFSQWMTYIILLISQSLVIIAFLNVMIKFGRLTNQHNEHFVRQWYLMMCLWIGPIEVIKALLIVYWKKTKNPSFWIIRKEEVKLLSIHKPEEFKDPPADMKKEKMAEKYIENVKLRNMKNQFRDEDLWNTLLEFSVCIAALIIIVGIACLTKDDDGYKYNQQLRRTFKIDPVLRFPNQTTDRGSYLEIQQSADFWKWAQNSLIGGLRVSWYDGKPAYKMRGFLNDKVSRAMGIGTIRQIRSEVKHGEPVMKMKYKTRTNVKFSQAKESKVFTQEVNGKLVNMTKKDGPEYRYRTAREMQNGKAEGSFRSYPGGGFAFNLEGTRDELNRTMQRLQANRWIDEWTRAVIIEFSSYNAQVNYFGVVELVIEFPNTNVMTPTAWIEPVRLIKYMGNDKEAIEMFENLYLAYCVLMFACELLTFLHARLPAVRQMRRRNYKAAFDIMIDATDMYGYACLLMSIVAFGSIFVYNKRQQVVNEVIREFVTNNGNSYMNLSHARNMDYLYERIYACVFFWQTVKSVVIFRFNRRISYFTDTLKACSRDVAGFSLVFFTSFFTFTGVMHCMLWEVLESYSSWSAAIQSNISALFGKNTESKIYQISTMCDIIFQLFMWMNNFLMINIFIMIVMGHFDQIRKDPKKQSNDYEIIDHVKTKIMQKLNLWQWKDGKPYECEDKRTTGTIKTARKIMAQVYEIIYLKAYKSGEPSGVIDRPPGFRRPFKPAQHEVDYPINVQVPHKFSRIEDMEDRKAMFFLNDKDHRDALAHLLPKEEFEAYLEAAEDEIEKKMNIEAREAAGPSTEVKETPAPKTKATDAPGPSTEAKDPKLPAGVKEL